MAVLNLKGLGLNFVCLMFVIVCIIFCLMFVFGLIFLFDFEWRSD